MLLAGDQTAEFRRERQRLVVDINDLQELSYHLPFDTGRLVPRREVIRALQHELSFMVGEARATEDRISYLKEQPGGLPQEWQDIVKRIQEWVVSDHDPAYGQRADELIQIIHALEPNASPAWTWREMVVANLAGQLAALVTGHRNAFYLVNVIDNSGPRDSAVVEALLDRTGSRSFHTDSGLAARSALGAVMTVLLVCSFWIATAWRDGSGAALIAGVTCALFGSLDNPAVPARKFLIGSIVGCCLAAIYGFVVLPRVTDFILLGAVLAPTLLLFGSALARPQTATLARGVLLGFVNAVGLNATYSRDFLGFVNGAIAQNVAIAFAIVMFVVFRTLGGEEAIRRLRRAGFRDVIGRIQDDNSEEARWTSKMLDRISILITRTTVQSPKPGDEVTEALQDLRVGVVAGDLKALSASSTKRQQEIIDGVLRSLAQFFSRRIRNASERPAPVLLAQIEELATEFRADPQVPRRRAAVVLAVSLRRDLFPAAELPGWTS